MKDSVYHLYINSLGRAPLLSFAKHDFLHHHFNGKSELAVWKKPRIQISAKSKPLKNVLTGSFQAPFVSEKFKQAIQPVCGSSAEFLPLTALKNTSFYVFNVVEVVDCLDIEKSEIVYSPSFPDRIMRVDRFIFHPGVLRPIAVFKIPQDLDRIFVTQPFIEAARRNRITGIGFDDPADIRLVKGASPVEGFPT
jgi:hypothetical protein